MGSVQLVNEATTGRCHFYLVYQPPRLSSVGYSDIKSRPTTGNFELHLYGNNLGLTADDVDNDENSESLPEVKVTIYANEGREEPADCNILEYSSEIIKCNVSSGYGTGLPIIATVDGLDTSDRCENTLYSTHGGCKTKGEWVDGKCSSMLYNTESQCAGNGKVWTPGWICRSLTEPIVEVRWTRKVKVSLHERRLSMDLTWRNKKVHKYVLL